VLREQGFRGSGPGLSQGITPKTKLPCSLAVFGFPAEIRWKPASDPGRGTGVWKD